MFNTVFEMKEKLGLYINTHKTKVKRIKTSNTEVFETENTVIEDDITKYEMKTCGDCAEKILCRNK